MRSFATDCPIWENGDQELLRDTVEKCDAAPHHILSNSDHVLAHAPGASKHREIDDRDRLQECLRALHHEIGSLPRAAQLSPIPDLPRVEARAIELRTRIGAASPKRPRRGMSFLTKSLITSTIVGSIAYVFATERPMQRAAEFAAPRIPSIQRGGPPGFVQAVPPSAASEGLPARGDTERSAAIGSLQPAPGVENKPAGDEIVAAPSPGAQGFEDSAPAREARVAGDSPPADPSHAAVNVEATKPLIDRGMQFLDAGDVAAARLLFNRAADTGDAVAALAMGKTYDPALLADRGVRGMIANPEKARTWYEKAAAMGSPEAMRLLKALDGDAASVRQTADQAPANAVRVRSPRSISIRKHGDIFEPRG